MSYKETSQMTDFDPKKVRWREVLTRANAAPILLICLGVWLHAADGLIVTTMMPAIVAELGGDAYVAWTIALYEVGSIVVGAASGLLSLRFGIRRPMIVAAATFGLGCFISATAPTMQVLLLGRLLQGLGGGGLTAMSFIAIAVLFPTRLSARVMALISVLWGSSAFLGPLIGGYFVAYANWRLGFVFFGAQAMFLALWIIFGIKIKEQPTPDGPIGTLPLRRLGLLCAGVVLIAYSGIEVNLTRTPLLLLLGITSLAGFLWLDGRNSGNRLLPRTPFDLRTPVGAALTMILLMNIGIMGLSTYGALLMTLIHGVPAIVAGYVLASIAIGWSTAAIILSGAPERHDPYYIAAGMLLVFSSVAGLIYAMPNGPVWLIALFGALEGVGYGTAYTFIIRRTNRAAPPEDVERLSAALPTVGRLGYALGAAVMGILANATGFSIDGSIADAARVSRVIFIGSLPIAFVGLLAMVVFVSKPVSGQTAAGSPPTK